MFPLGSVALPGSIVPLHIFEDRYRQMMRDLQGSGGRFGVVLIDRGSEVGGGEQRRTVGTRVRISEAQEFDDGRWAIFAVAEDRIRVVTWLPDDPYPVALVETLPAGDPPSAEALQLAEASVRKAHGLAAELGYDVPEFDDVLVGEPHERLWQLGLFTPCGPIDKQAILEADTSELRADCIAAAALDAAQMFTMQLGRGDAS